MSTIFDEVIPKLRVKLQEKDDGRGGGLKRIFKQFRLKSGQVSGKVSIDETGFGKALKAYGFDLSEKDLIMRGGGEILGKNQYGYEDFIFFDISIHQDLLKMATLEATDILNKDPNLASDRGKKLIDLLYLFEKNKAIDFISAG